MAANRTVPNPSTGAPYIPSTVEAKNYLYGLPSKARFIARSSPDVWVKPTGPEAYLEAMELHPLGPHKLNTEIWEFTVGPAMVSYLLVEQVQFSLLLPVRVNRTASGKNDVALEEYIDVVEMRGVVGKSPFR